MSYTTTTATIRIREIINEDTADFWDDTEIQEWLSQGCYDFSVKTRLVETSGDITLVDGQMIYDSTDLADLAYMLDIKTAYYDDGTNQRTLQRISSDHIGNIQVSSGRPRYFFEHNKKIYLQPTPTSTEAGNTITVLFSKSADSIDDLKDEYQWYPILYAITFCRAKARQHGEAVMMQQLYLNGISFLRGDIYDKSPEITESFKVPDHFPRSS